MTPTRDNMNINIHIDINMNIDININIDIHIIIDMNIEDYKRYYLLINRYVFCKNNSSDEKQYFHIVMGVEIPILKK